MIMSGWSHANLKKICAVMPYFILFCLYLFKYINIPPLFDYPKNLYNYVIMVGQGEKPIYFHFFFFLVCKTDSRQISLFIFFSKILAWFSVNSHYMAFP